METFITLLRGINVGGRNSIPISGLKSLYEKLGFLEITTYIQSGNLVFRAKENISPGQAAENISKGILKTFGAEVVVLVRTKKELAKIIASNPFLKNKAIDLKKLHVTFLDALPAKDRLEGIANLAFPPDEFRIMGTEVFLYCPVSYGETKLSNRFFESKLKVGASTRNWNTVNILFQLAEKVS